MSGGKGRGVREAPQETPPAAAATTDIEHSNLGGRFILDVTSFD